MMFLWLRTMVCISAGRSRKRKDAGLVVGETGIVVSDSCFDFVCLRQVLDFLAMNILAIGPEFSVKTLCARSFCLSRIEVQSL